MSLPPPSETQCVKKILWVAPSLNHYKAALLNRLGERNDVSLAVIAGSNMSNLGHLESEVDHEAFDLTRLKATYYRFAFSPSSYLGLARAVRRIRPDWLLVPSEKKFLPLILFAKILRVIFGCRLFTISHRTCTPGSAGDSHVIARMLFSLYDRVGFYTQQAEQWAKDRKLVRPARSFFVNNTLDTKSIWSQTQYSVNRCEGPAILFIGRLVPSKRVDRLIDYHRELKSRVETASLRIIGAGPLESDLRDAASELADVSWLGAIGDEAIISQEMQKAHFVFVPGASGLSVVHAFCYGKPYITIDASDIIHGPEVAYLEDDSNGLMLQGDINEDVIRVIDVFRDSDRYERMCHAALETGKGLSVENWSEQLLAGLS